MSDTPERPDRTLPIILGIIGVLVVVAALVVFTRGTPAQLDPATPQGTVQQYVTAVLDGDQKAAAELLSPTWLEECDPLSYGPDSTQRRVSLISTDENDTSATVRVTVSYGPGGDPFGSEYEYEDSFRLDKSGDSWLIATVPWEFAVCPAGGSK